MSSKPTVIYTAANLPQAHILRNLLEDLGIPATVSNDAVQQAIGDIPAGWSTAPRVVVAEEHAELARRVALEFDAPGHDSPRDDDVTGDPEDTIESAGSPPQPPLLACPRCGSRRQAVCAYCGTSGDDFVAADSSDSRSAGTRRPWLICSTCEEPSAAQYERVCERCGHDYGEGADRPKKAPALLFSRFGLALMVIGLAATVLLVLWQPTMACLLLLVIGLATMARWALGGPTP
jgi:Putative prokaryotic signal transducing protein